MLLAQLLSRCHLRLIQCRKLKRSFCSRAAIALASDDAVSAPPLPTTESNDSAPTTRTRTRSSQPESSPADAALRNQRCSCQTAGPRPARLTSHGAQNSSVARHSGQSADCRTSCTGVTGNFHKTCPAFERAVADALADRGVVLLSAVRNVVEFAQGCILVQSVHFWKGRCACAHTGPFHGSRTARFQVWI